MALSALQHVGDAVDVTREFLFPFELRRWLKLALVAFFVGGSGGSVPTSGFDTGGFETGGPPGQDPGQAPDLSLPTLTDEMLLVLAVVVGALLLLAVAFAVVGAVMEFVFVESLVIGEVTVRRYWGRRWGQGLRLFAFRLAIGLPLLVVVLGWLAVLLVPLLTGESFLPMTVFLLGIPVVFLLFVLHAVVSTFTTVFVVPIMLRRDGGVLDGWGVLWSSVKSDWKQYAAFAALWLVLTIATGLVASIAVGIGAVVLLVPFAIVGVVAAVATGLSTAGLAVVAVLVVVFVVAVLVLAALVQVPVLAYLRYYALLVLGDLEPDYDLIPERRRAVADVEGE